MDDLLHLEARFVQEGRQQALDKVQVDGQAHGYPQGVRQGLEMGKRLGVIQGWVEVCAKIMPSGTLPARAANAVVALQPMLATFDLHSETVVQDLQALEAKFKVLQSALGLKPQGVASGPSLDF